MFTIFSLAIKNIVSRKSSFAIVLFISFSIALLVVSNSVFDRTEFGIEEVFENSFTGDFVIRPKANVQLSLFGDETPVTGQLSKIETLVPYEEIKKLLLQNPQIKSIIPQITGTGFAENNGAGTPLYIFGVDSSEYVKLMPSIRIIDGSAFASGEKGALLCKQIASNLSVSAGDTIQFTVVDGPTFRIRAVPVTGIYEWKVPHDIMMKFCIVNPETVRSIMNITQTVSDSDIEESETDLLVDSTDVFDSLFEDAFDTDAVVEDIADSVTSAEEVDFVADAPVIEDSASWNFIICSAKENTKTGKIIKFLNKQFKKNGWQIEAVSWRYAAGRNAMYLYWMRIIFNAGILIILFAGFIVVNNALVINVLDRINEIGTMRAIGSSKLFVALLFMCETIIITGLSGILGDILGTLISSVVSAFNISFNNSFLIQLFGGNHLITQITFSNLRNSLMLALFLGIIGWIYPLKTALNVSPVSAMNGAKK